MNNTDNTNKLSKVDKLMNNVKKLTVEELIEFCNQFDEYRETIIKSLGGSVMSTNKSDAKETKSATKESKGTRHANKTKRNIMSIDRENAFAEGFKAGDETCEDDTILTCAKTNNDTVVGGQCIINNTVCNYSYYVQFGKAVVYSNDITKEQLEELEENIHNEIPAGVRVFDAVPSNSIESPTHDSRWYYDEIEEGSFIFSNPDGSYMGYTDEYAFIIRESGFMEAIKMNYVFGKSWRKPSDELKDAILSLKERAFGDNNNNDGPKTNTKSSNEVTRKIASKINKHNRNIPFNRTPQNKNKKKHTPNKIPEDKLDEAAKMQRLDLSILDD